MAIGIILNVIKIKQPFPDTVQIMTISRISASVF